MEGTEPFDISSAPDFFLFFKRLFINDFMPHGHCYFWRPDILWLNVLSDAAISLAYYMISFSLLYFLIKREKNIPFPSIFILFGAFIFLCGLTHTIEIFTVWNPWYRFEGLMKLATGVVSMVTAAVLVPIVPKAVKLPGMRKLNDELKRKTEALESANHTLARFNKLSLGREARIIELKKEVNEFLIKQNLEPKYKVEPENNE